TLDAATAVHQHHVAFLQPLRRTAAVRKRRVLPKADEYPTRRTERAKRRGTDAAKLALRHAFGHAVARCFVSLDRDVVRLLHQRKFGRRLEHATAGGDRRRIDVLQRRSSLTNSVKQEEPDTLFHADSA